MSGIDPPISEADVGRWFVDRHGDLRRIDWLNDDVVFQLNGGNEAGCSWNIHGVHDYANWNGAGQQDLIRRATASDFLRLAMDTLGRDTPEGEQFALMAEVFADWLEERGATECQRVREAIR